MGRTELFSLGSVLVASAFAAAGCGGGGGGGGGGAFVVADARAPMAATTQGTTAATALAVQATLAAIDTQDFRPLTAGTATVTSTGNATSGTVTINFGTATIVNNATYSGSITVTYSTFVRNGNQGTGAVSIAFQGFSFSTQTLGNTTVTGTLVLQNFTYNAGVQVAATSGSTITCASSARGTFTVQPTTLAWVYQAPGGGLEQQQFTEDDTIGGSLGQWTLTESNMLQAISGGTTRAISRGDVTLNPIGTTIFTFNALNSGTEIVAPSGLMLNFSL